MIEQFNNFCHAAGLDIDQGFRRRAGVIYATVRITEGPVGEWFSRFVGVEFLAEPYFDKNRDGRRRVETVVPVRMRGQDIIRGKPIPGKYISLI